MSAITHVNKAAAGLGDLNVGGTELVAKAVLRATHDFLRAGNTRPIRILDIGCGTSPYLHGDVLRDVSASFFTSTNKEVPAALVALADAQVTCLDHNAEVFEAQAFGRPPLAAGRKLCQNFFDYAITTADPPCDIVIFSAVLHETRLQWALSSLDSNNRERTLGRHGDPAGVVLELLGSASFVRPETVLIVSDIFYPGYWSADELESAIKTQARNYGHADPAAAFLTGVEIVRHARCARLELQAYEERSSIPEAHYLCADIQHGRVFRSRRAYCASFTSVSPHPSGIDSRVETTVVQRDEHCPPGNVADVIRGSTRRRLKTHPQINSSLRHFQQVLRTDAPQDPNLYHRLLSEEILLPLAISGGDLIRDWCQTSMITAPRILSYWFGIDSIVLGGRYAPRRGDEWLSHRVDPRTGNGLTAGASQDWASLCFNSFVSPDHMSTWARTLSGWLEGLQPPSIYRWLTSSSAENAALRSLSIVCMPDDVPAVAASAHLSEDALVLQRYSPFSNRAGPLEGHMLIALSGDADDAFRLGLELDELCGGTYCMPYRNEDANNEHQRERRAILHSIASLYIDSLFLARFNAVGHPFSLHQLLADFKNRWLSNNTVQLFDPARDDLSRVGKLVEDGVAPLPSLFQDRIERFCEKARALAPDIDSLPTVWTSSVIRQSGRVDPNVTEEVGPTQLQRDEPIATIMLMTDRACDPALLELMSALFDETFFSIREAEVARVVRENARSQATQAMLRSFGHDGRRHATAITQALQGDTNIGRLALNERTTIAGWFARSLASRLFVFQTLIGEYDATPEFFQEETDRRVGEISLRHLLRREVATVLLRCAVETAEFTKLAKLLHLDEYRSHLLTFAASAATWDAADEAAALAQLEADLSAALRITWSGFEGVGLPTDLDAYGNLTPVSRISVGLSFLISELLTNVFRHQWSEWGQPFDAPPQIAFALSADESAFRLSVTCWPAKDMVTSFRKAVGLESLEFVVRALGTTITRRQLTVGGKVRTLAFPIVQEDGSVRSVIGRIAKSALILKS